MNYYSQMEQPARIRFANQTNMPIDIYLNDQMIIRGFNPGQKTQFIPLPRGMYNIKLYSSTGNLLLNQNQDLALCKLITVMQDNQGIISLKITDDFVTEPYFEARDQVTPGRVMIRFGHFSPNSPAVDITLPNGTVLFRNIPYRTVTNYITIAPGAYSLQVRAAGTNQVVLTVPDVAFTANDVKSIYAIGLLNGTPPLEVIVVNDRNV